jgi:hypothetical protein
MQILGQPFNIYNKRLQLHNSQFISHINLYVTYIAKSYEIKKEFEKKNICNSVVILWIHVWKQPSWDVCWGHKYCSIVTGFRFPDA